MTKTTKIPPGGWTKRQQKAHRKQLIAALRSGEYSQTNGQLTNGKGYCCLGVACEISGLGGWVDGEDKGWMYEVNSGDQSCTYLPREVAAWLGFSYHAGNYGNDGGSLAVDNDNGKRFSTIANIIESEPEGLIVK